MNRSLPPLLTEKELESGGSDGGYAVSSNSSGRNSIRSNGSPIENSVVDFSTKDELYSTVDLIPGEFDENVFSDFLEESTRRLSVPTNLIAQNGLKIPKKRTRRKSATEIRLCLVCGDKATGYHFNAMTCEGCKGFFRRSVKNSRRFACAYRNECEITPHNRRKCQSCRYNKCIQIGMKSDCVLNDHELEEKRKVILKNRMKRISSSSQPVSNLNDLSQTNLNELVRIFNASMGKNFSPKFFRYYHNIKTVKKRLKDWNRVQNSMRTDERILYVSKSISDNKKVTAVTINIQYVSHIADIITTLFYETINFCKQMAEFMAVEENDQLSLLKSAAWPRMTNNVLNGRKFIYTLLKSEIN
jgi:hypothetical protein